MARRKQRKHSAEFKFKLVLEALKEERSRLEIAREHDLTKSLLYKWEQAFLAKGATVFTTTEKQQVELAEREAQIADLERIVGQLTLENRILKKCATKSGGASARNER